MLPLVATKLTSGMHTTAARTRNTYKPAATANYSVPVVRSTFGILEALSRADHLGLREVTEMTGVPKSTVFRVLSTLVDLGYVTRDANRNYRISPRLGHLVSDEAKTEELRRLALPLMLELRDKFGETVNLGVQQLEKVTYLEVVPSEFALRLQESRGASVPVHASALGKAILAFSPQDSVDHFIRGYKFERVTEHTIVDPDEFLTELKRVRNQGFAFDRGEDSLLAVCIGAPILGADGSALAAMSISGPASRFNPQKDSPAISSLMKATMKLSRTFARATAHK